MISELKHESEFKKAISEGDVLLDFYANWCGPCQSMEEHLEKLSVVHPTLKIIKINVDKSSILAAMHRVNSIPAYFFYRNGKFVRSAIGAMEYTQLERLIK